MSDNIKTITDRKQFQDIFYKFFMGDQIFFKARDMNLKIKFFGYSDGLAAFKVPYLKNISENCLVFSKLDDNIIYAHLKFAEKQEEDLYLFYPVKIQIIFSARKENRKAVDESATGKKVIFVNNVLSDFIIVNCLAMAQKKVDRIKETIKFDIEKLFHHIKIYLINEGTSDPRMKYFIEGKPPINIFDFKNAKKTEDQKFVNFYLNEIYSRDYYLINRKNFVSEVSVPILYRGKIPYGYIQVNNTTPFTESASTVIKRVAIIAEELFNKNNVFPKAEEKLLVSDISKSGLAIAFNERRFIRYFKEGSLVYFDLILPDKKKAAVLAVVRNISLLENKIIKIGCQIKELDALSEVHYDEYLESIGLPTE